MDYYKAQMEKVFKNYNKKDVIVVKFSGKTVDSNFFSINKESAKVIVDKLKEVYEL